MNAPSDYSKNSLAIPIIGSIAITALVLGGFLLFVTSARITAIEEQLVEISAALQRDSEITKTASTESPWKIAFDLPSGWRYAGFADYESFVPAEEKITDESGYVLLTDAKSPFAIGGRGPNWGPTSGPDKDIGIKINLALNNWRDEHGATMLVNGLYKLDIRETENCKNFQSGKTYIGEEESVCGNAAEGNPKYWFRVDGNWYRADVFGYSIEDYSQIENILMSARTAGSVQNILINGVDFKAPLGWTIEKQETSAVLKPVAQGGEYPEIVISVQDNLKNLDARKWVDENPTFFGAIDSKSLEVKQGVLEFTSEGKWVARNKVYQIDGAQKIVVVSLNMLPQDPTVSDEFNALFESLR